jgi:acetyltransferase-like isoleucine patch superfamily enzyme
MPAPRIIFRPLLWAFLIGRSCYHSLLRIFVAEPFFKAYCKEYGKNLHTDCHIHWINGKGDIIVGDNVTIEGLCSFSFATRYTDHPTLKIGDNTGIGHGCNFAIGKQITIGKYCNLSGGIWIADSNGHPTNAAERMAYAPPSDDEVRPVVIGDGVWIGRNCLIFPGVKIGEGTVISAGSVVRGHLPPYCVAAGNPAKVLIRLKRPTPATETVANSVADLAAPSLAQVNPAPVNNSVHVNGHSVPSLVTPSPAEPPQNDQLQAAGR